MTADMVRERLEAAGLRLKPLEWVADHGVAALGPYRLFQVVTSLGRWSYGTDAEGAPYWHSQAGAVFTVRDEATARRQAEATWEKAALAEVAKYLALSNSTGEAE